GGHRVAEHHEHTSPRDVSQRCRLALDIIEVGRTAHIGGSSVPLKRIALRHWQAAPPVISAEYVGIILREHIRSQARADHLLNLLTAGPDLAQKYRLAVAVCPERLSKQISPQRA